MGRVDHSSGVTPLFHQCHFHAFRLTTSFQETFLDLTKNSIYSENMESASPTEGIGNVLNYVQKVLEIEKGYGNSVLHSKVYYFQSTTSQRAEK